MRRLLLKGALAIGSSAAALACAVIAGIDEFSPAPMSEDGALVEAAAGDATVGDTGALVVVTADGAPACVTDPCPSVFAEVDDPRSIAVAFGHVLWAAGGTGTSDGVVQSCPETGCPPTGPVVLADGLARPHVRQPGRVADAIPLVYEITPLGGGGVRAFTDAGALERLMPPRTVEGAAASSRLVVWSEATSLEVCVRLGQTCVVSTTLGEQSSSPIVAASGLRIVWTPLDGGIQSSTLGPASPTTTTLDPSSAVNDLLLDQGLIHAAVSPGVTTIYEDAGGNATPEGGVRSVVAMGATSLGLDATHVYVAGGGGVYAIDKATGQTALRFAGSARAVAAGETHLFTAVEGAILIQPK